MYLIEINHVINWVWPNNQIVFINIPIVAAAFILLRPSCIDLLLSDNLLTLFL